MLIPNVDVSLPKGRNLNCVFIFLQGEVEHLAKTTSSVPVPYPYQWVETGSAKAMLAHQQLVRAKAEAYQAYLKYVADFEKKFPSGYIMYRKTEWRFAEEVDQNLGIYMKQIQLDGVPSEF